MSKPGEDDSAKSLGTRLKEALSLDAPAYPTQEEAKHEEKEQMTEPADEFRDMEPNRARTTQPEPDAGPRT
ncbi:MAG: hypothetical protein JO069_16055 [Verrucomicrobia bacterium]|nr:hypothetical protein [Verrucomicrobiota bacterium]